MAKGNLFLGGASGSVGDVTFYTKNGQQISRVRRRSVKNPNTSGQLYQRAILSTVVKAYQAGSTIFDHSFEGVATGAASQARFQKVNINLIRQLVEADIAANASESQHHAAVVPRGSVWPVPNVYRVSQGSLVQDFFTMGSGPVDPSVIANPPVAEETVSEWLARNAIIDDDIFTIVGFGITDASDWSDDDETRFRRSYECRFGFIRLRVRSEALEDTSTATEAAFTKVFKVESSTSRAVINNRLVTQSITIDDLLNGASTGAIGVIRSRENQRLRSTCDLVIPTTQPDNLYVQWGIVGKYIPEFWSGEAVGLGQSPLILEGGSINVGR